MIKPNYVLVVDGLKNPLTPCKASMAAKLLKAGKALKILRILSERYRNRRKRFSLRFNLIAAIYDVKLIL